MGGFNKAQQAYNDALDDKQTASDLRSYRITRDFIKGQLKDAKTDNDPTKALDGAKEDLDAAEKSLKDCPPKGGAMVTATIFVT